MIEYDENGRIVSVGGKPVDRADVTAEGEGESSPSFFGEAARAIGGGIRDGVQELAETAHWAGDAVWQSVVGDGDLYTTSEGVKWLSAEEAAARLDIPEWQRSRSNPFAEGGQLELPEVADNQTMIGSIARGAAQFAAGYGVLGKVAKGTKMLSGSKFLNTTALSTATDAAAFDAHDERISNFLMDNFGMRNAVAEFLAADEDDTVGMGRLKNALEGLGVGMAADGVARVFKAYKTYRKAKANGDPEAAAEAFFKDMDETNTRMADEERAQELVKEADETGVPLAEPKPIINTEGFKAQVNHEMALRRAGSHPDEDAAVGMSLFNENYMDGDYTAKQLIEMSADAVEQAGYKGTTTFAEMDAESMRYIADVTGENHEIIRQSLAEVAQAAEKMPQVMLGTKKLMQDYYKRIGDLAEKISYGQHTDEDLLRYDRLEQLAIETSAQLKSVIRGAAQTTTAGRIRTKDVLTGEAMDAVEEAIKKTGSLDKESILKRARAITKARRAGAGDAGIHAVTKTREHGHKIMNIINEVFINGILSGPKTHIVNAMSNALMTAVLPAEKFLGGAMMGDGRMMREAGAQVVGSIKAIDDAFRMMMVAIRENKNILDPESGTNEVTRNAIVYSGDNPIMGALVNGQFGIGNIIRLPSRGLMGGDEFFKQLNYRSHLYSRLYSAGRDMVKDGRMKPENLGQWIEDNMQRGFGKNGQATSHLDLQFSREASFTQDLRADSMAKGMQNFTAKHPFARLIIPFIRTPMNILRAGAQRTPLINGLSKQIREDIMSGDPARKAQAMGKLGSSALIWSWAASMAYQGNITGSGPADPKLKQTLMETGWRPYSFKRELPDGSTQYVEYKRFEPFAMIFGIAADVADIGGSVGEAEIDEIAIAAVAALVNNVGSKTYLQGIVDAAEVMADPKRNLNSYLARQTTAMLPYSSLMRQVRQQQDPYMREARSLVDAVKNQIPGFSDNLPPKISWVTGKPILYPRGVGPDVSNPLLDAVASVNPITEGLNAGDTVLNELADLGYVFSPPTRKIDGVELSDEQYSRYMELHGTIRLGRKTLHERLGAIMETKGYDINRERYGDSDDPNLSKRKEKIDEAVADFRRKAKDALLREYPELAEQARENRALARQQQRKKSSGLSAISELAPQ